MSTATAAETVSDRRAGRIDHRPAYISFACAYLVGHGAFAVSLGDDPLVNLPGWLPLTLLAAGVLTGMAAAVLAGSRAQHGADRAERLTEKLLGTAWATGFVALFLAITGLTTALDMPELQSVLWPTGSVFVVGMINIAEGAARGNTLHYNLGSWLALVSTAALFLSTPGPFWVLALAGGGAYVVAALLESRRLAAYR